MTAAAELPASGSRCCSPAPLLPPHHRRAPHRLPASSPTRGGLLPWPSIPSRRPAIAADDELHQEPGVPCLLCTSARARWSPQPAPGAPSLRSKSAAPRSGPSSYLLDLCLALVCKGDRRPKPCAKAQPSATSSSARCSIASLLLPPEALVLLRFGSSRPTRSTTQNCQYLYARIHQDRPG